MEQKIIQTNIPLPKDIESIEKRFASDLLSHVMRKLKRTRAALFIVSVVSAIIIGILAYTLYDTQTTPTGDTSAVSAQVEGGNNG